MTALSAGPRGVTLRVHAQAGARRDEIAGMHDDRLKVKVTAPPEDGRANERIVEVLAEALGLRRGDIELISGPTSRRKDFLLGGVSLPDAERRLADALGSSSAGPRPS